MLAAGRVLIQSFEIRLRYTLALLKAQTSWKKLALIRTNQRTWLLNTYSKIKDTFSIILRPKISRYDRRASESNKRSVLRQKRKRSILNWCERPFEVSHSLEKKYPEEDAKDIESPDVLASPNWFLQTEMGHKCRVCSERFKSLNKTCIGCYTQVRLNLSR